MHGTKFKLKDPTPWGEPVEKVELAASRLGRVRVWRWLDLHFRPAAFHPMEVLRVERLEAKGPRRDPKELGLAWSGAAPLPVAEGGREYLRRFALDHWDRLAKQRLPWTLPRRSTPEQADPWSDLRPLLTWPLWLARPLAVDGPLPWQKPQTLLTPERVGQGMGGGLARIGTPAQAPNPRGTSPGWPEGQPRRHRPRYPVVKKGRNRRRKAA